ncbi:MAG: hypothetical protein M3O34_15220 [Chloroflexota bacterium]|nr:hypothetical protein [Chloroflexota bacterium]
MIGRGARYFGLARWFWDAVREVNPAQVRADMEQRTDIAVFGRPGSGRHSLIRALFGPDAEGRPEHGIAVFDLGVGAVAAAGPLDLAILVLNAAEPDWTDERRIAHQVAGRGHPVMLVLTHLDALERREQGRQALLSHFPGHPPELTALVDPRDAEGTRAALVRKILATIPGSRLALGYRYPTLRRAVADDLIRETSRVNGQFALMSSLPALIPVLGFFIGGMADVFILTKNQALLVFKLAAIYGRDIEDRTGVIREIMPVIGGAFVWRTVARSAAGALGVMGGPAAVLSAVPKAAIGYIGTYVVGEAARYYYERGKEPPPEVLVQFREEARRLYAELNEVLKARIRARGGRPVPAAPSGADAERATA